MIFSEIYSTYYNVLSKLIDKAIDGQLNQKVANEIIRNNAFNESIMYIIDSIRNEDWQVITKDYKTPIKNNTSIPLTTLQLRFLKAITLDKRFSLFTSDIIGLDKIEPLYYPQDFVYYDVNKDGDPYDDFEYRAIFKLILQSLNEKRLLKINFIGGKGVSHKGIYTPRKLEYSIKDDKFRLHCRGLYKPITINVGRITACELLDKYDENVVKPFVRKKAIVKLLIIDERNALERSMIHFANYEKQTKQIDNKTYEMLISYNQDDETELVIRVLSFGPMIKVISPQKFINLIKQRLNNQKKL